MEHEQLQVDLELMVTIVTSAAVPIHDIAHKMFSLYAELIFYSISTFAGFIHDRVQWLNGNF